MGEIGEQLPHAKNGFDLLHRCPAQIAHAHPPEPDMEVEADGLATAPPHRSPPLSSPPLPPYVLLSMAPLTDGRTDGRTVFELTTGEWRARRDDDVDGATVAVVGSKSLREEEEESEESPSASVRAA